LIQIDQVIACLQIYFYSVLLPYCATNLETLSDSKVIHFYNQRGEDSENRIKELKNDFVFQVCLSLLCLGRACFVVRLNQDSNGLNALMLFNTCASKL
jgi:hypothetical protein